MHMWGLKSKRKARHQQGMTLLEVVLSVVMLAMLATACFSLASKLGTQSTDLRNELVLSQAIRTTIEETREFLYSHPYEIYPTEHRSKDINIWIGSDRVQLETVIISKEMSQYERLHKLRVTATLNHTLSCVEVFIYVA